MCNGKCGTSGGLAQWLYDRLFTSPKGKGVVRWFDPIRGYGFIAPRDRSCDVFVTLSQVKLCGLTTLTQGDVVDFQVSTSGEEVFASNITMVDGKCTSCSEPCNQPQGNRERGTVKWYNAVKGYGFIQPQSGARDLFVHVSAAERAGLSTLNEGALIDFFTVTNRGKSSAEDLRLVGMIPSQCRCKTTPAPCDTPKKDPPPPEPTKKAPPAPPTRVGKMTGRVSWYNPIKGYGFIQPDDGGKTVFLHVSAVERAGLTTLSEGQRVEFEIYSSRGRTTAEQLRVF